MIRRFAPALCPLFFLSLASCQLGLDLTASRVKPPIPGAVRVDELIQPGEVHFERLWKLTSGGENAEAYWSYSDDRLVLQRRNEEDGIDCDRIYVTDAATGKLTQVSNGRGVTTCAFFLPGDRKVVYASTHDHHETCPPPPDRSRGYVWSIYPEFDLYVRDLKRGIVTRLTSDWGYDAEATVSPQGDRMVFTSTRSGDLELWTANLDGTDLVQVTDEPGYDGGAFFSHDGEQLIFRATAFSEENRDQEIAEYRALLGEWLVRPSKMELYVVDTDGFNRRQLTALGGANWAPYFFPDDQSVIFCTNHHAESPREFDLFAIGVDGEGLHQVTTYEGFDSFPMFSRDGRWLVFASNRGGTEEGETNLFVAEWK